MRWKILVSLRKGDSPGLQARTAEEVALCCTRPLPAPLLLCTTLAHLTGTLPPWLSPFPVSRPQPLVSVSGPRCLHLGSDPPGEAVGASLCPVLPIFLAGPAFLSVFTLTIFRSSLQSQRCTPLTCLPVRCRFLGGAQLLYQLVWGPGFKNEVPVYSIIID